MTGDPTTAAGNGAAERTRPRWMFYLLLASLALNLLFVAGAATAAWRFHHHGGKHGGPHGGGLKGFVRQLPDDRRRELGADMKAARESLRPTRDEIRSAWNKVNVVIGTDPFDRAAAEAAIAELTAAEARFKSGLSKVLLDTAAKLTSEERKMYQAWREARQKRRDAWREKRKKDREDDDDAP